MKNQYQVIKKPIITERATAMKEDLQKVVFGVHPDANKHQIKAAVESIFKVKVTSVNTLNYKGKPKRLGAHAGKRSGWKKAVVTIAEGEKLDFLEG